MNTGGAWGHGRARSLLGKRSRGTKGEGNGAGGMGKGSLSVLIVAIESWETEPREPVSSQAAHQRDGTVDGKHGRYQRSHKKC